MFHRNPSQRSPDPSADEAGMQRPRHSPGEPDVEDSPANVRPLY